MKIISYIQNNFGLSRRNITGLIDQTCILLDGKIVASYKQEIQNNCELIIKSPKLSFKGICKIPEPKSDYKMIIFNKPKGYVVSKSDSNNKTIYQILPNDFKNYYYIGRLDKDSHGLLLLTNNTKLVNKYEHPSNQVEKEYVVKIDKKINKLDIQRMLDGIKDDGDLLKFANIKLIGEVCYNIILTEGKKRHIRRVFKFLGYSVVDLQRVREGEFELGNIKIGGRKTLNIKI